MMQFPSLTGDTDDEAYGMNESGQIVGYADSPDARRHALLWTKDQVAVCHVDGHGRVKLITVAGPAVAAHLTHGDALAGLVLPVGSSLSSSASLSAETSPEYAFDGKSVFSLERGRFPHAVDRSGFRIAATVLCNIRTRGPVPADRVYKSRCDTGRHAGIQLVRRLQPPRIAVSHIWDHADCAAS